jgi:hypothetical protein
MDTSSSADPTGMRASDADRNQVAALLGEALAAGRLTFDEHAERLDAAYSARTFGDLEKLVADLPLTEMLRPAAGRDGGDREDDCSFTRALFSKIRRCGQWPVPARSTAVARFGAIVLDFRHAVFSQREVTLDAVSFCGKVEIYVPENARVYDTGGALLGKRTLPSSPPEGSDGPTIRIRGRSVLGHIRVTRGGPRNHHWNWDH